VGRTGLSNRSRFGRIVTAVVPDQTGGGRYRWVGTAAQLDDLIDELVTEPAYALDTEFHRERTYFPKVALVQIGWPGGIALIDPLAVDLMPLSRVLLGDGMCVLHAAQQDLEVLARSAGTVPKQMYDTQIAASFLGHATPSLANLIQAELGLKLPKGDRLTDWLKRPLTEDQKSYAASDVEHLLVIYERQTKELEDLGRLSWVQGECENLRLRPTGPNDPEQAWLRLKDVRALRGKARNVARAVAGWREARAAAIDQPVRFVLPDLAILGIAQRAPTTLEDLRSTRGVEDRHGKGAIGEELLAAIRSGANDTSAPPVERDENDLERNLRPAVTLVSAWVSQLARDERIDTSILATRSDIVALLARDPDARLSTGWRGGLVGDNIRRLVEGEAALAFDGKGQLRLVTL
jgi:ribonuclease D